MANWQGGRGPTTTGKNKWEEVQTFTKEAVFLNGFRNDGPINDGAKIKTADYTAALGEHLMVNTTSNVVTITLPPAPESMDVVVIEDAKGTFDTNNLTIARNSNKIEGLAEDFTCDQAGATIVLRYIDSTFGWRLKIY
jgi:hypothetical protein